jgi:hypothetical protein
MYWMMQTMTAVQALKRKKTKKKNGQTKKEKNKNSFAW